MKNITFLAFCMTAFVSTSIMGQDALCNYGAMQIHPTANIGLLGDFINQGTFKDSGATVNFNGTTAQLIRGNQNTAFNNLHINNLAGVSMKRDIQIDHKLTLTNGAFILDSNTLRIERSTPLAIVRSSGYIVSEYTDNSSSIVWKIGTATGTYSIPFGTFGGLYIPASLQLTSGDIGNFTICTYPTAANNLPLPVAPEAVTHLLNPQGNDNSGNCVDRFWQSLSDGPNGVATLTFNATPVEVGALTNLQAQCWNPSSIGWDAPLPGQTSLPFGATVGNVSRFSVWTLSTTSNPMPVDLLEFSAFFKAPDVAIEWVSASELFCDHYTVYRSTNNEDFDAIIQVQGSGNSNSNLYYSVIDADPLPGLYYYKLAQTDFNGATVIYKTVEVVVPEFLQSMQCTYTETYASGNFEVLIQKPEQGTGIISITDFSGQNLYTELVSTDEAIFVFDPAQINLIQGNVYVFSYDQGTQHCSLLIHGQ